jgi:hypothetical protein
MYIHTYKYGMRIGTWSRVFVWEKGYRFIQQSHYWSFILIRILCYVHISTLWQFLRNIVEIHVKYNSHKISIMAYRPVAKRWLCKQRSLLANALNTHAHNNRRTVFSMWSVPRYYNREFWSLVSLVLYWRLWRKDLSAWSWRITTVRSRYQGTDGEDTAGWKRFSGCCDDLWIVEIIGGAVIVRSSESCV